MITTVISEMAIMFKTNIQMINSLRGLELAEQAEDLVYNIELEKTIKELEIELEKAKQIKDGN